MKRNVLELKLLEHLSLMCFEIECFCEMINTCRLHQLGTTPKKKTETDLKNLSNKNENMFDLQRISKENLWWLHSHSTGYRTHCGNSTVATVHIKYCAALNSFQINQGHQTQDLSVEVYWELSFLVLSIIILKIIILNNPHL